MTTFTKQEAEKSKPDRNLQMWFRWSGLVGGLVAGSVTLIVGACGIYYTFGRDILDNSKAHARNSEIIEKHHSRLTEVERWQILRDGLNGFNAADGAALKADLVDRLATMNSQLAGMQAILIRIERKQHE